MGSRSRARRSGAAVVMRSSGLAHSICNSMHGGAVGHWQKPRYWIPLWYDRLAFERYRRSPAFARVSARSRPEYLRALKRIKVLPTKTVDQVGDLLASSISARAADKIYAALQDGPRGKRVRQANLSIDIGGGRGNSCARLYPNVVGTENPFDGVLKIGGSKTKVAATRADAYTLANALKEIGEPHLGAAALICFEWLQRPENVLTGKISWGDYRSGNHVGIFHPKTGEVALQPLEDKGRKLYPELEKYLADLPRLGVAIVVTEGSRSVAALRDGLCAGEGPRSPTAGFLALGIDSSSIPTV